MTRATMLLDHVPVLIVGAGPTGLMSANLLGTYGIEALLIEQNAATSDLPKAILLDDEGLRALQAAGLSDEVVARVVSGYGARYYAPDGTCFAEVTSPVTRHGFPRRNAFLQPELEGILLKGLDRFDHVGTTFNARLLSIDDRGNAVVVQIDLGDGRQHQVSCGFLLACDGGRSGVREQLDIPMPGMTDARDWVVVDTLNDPDCDRFSKFFCDPARPMVSIPAPRGGRRYEFMILPGENPQQMAARETIRSVLKRFRVVPDDDILRAVVYTFHARVAERLCAGRISLLGDAAHLSPPFAGQGMNAGLRDAFNLTWKLKLALDHDDPGRIIETYQAERKGPVTDMINYAVELGEIVMPVGGLDEAAKQQIRASLMGIQDSTAGAVSMRPKPEAVYTKGWRLPAKCPSGQGLTGQALPQFPVQGPAGGRYMLDDVLGPGFALLAVGALPEREFAELADIDVNLICPTKVALRFDRSAEAVGQFHPVSPLGDDFGLHEHSGSVLLVRPDRFVAAHWQTVSATDMSSQIAGLCK